MHCKGKVSHRLGVARRWVATLSPLAFVRAASPVLWLLVDVLTAVWMQVTALPAAEGGCRIGGYQQGTK